MSRLSRSLLVLFVAAVACHCGSHSPTAPSTTTQPPLASPQLGLATTDQKGNATVNVPTVGSVTVQVVDQNGAGIAGATVAAANDGTVGASANGYIPAIVLGNPAGSTKATKLMPQSVPSFLVHLLKAAGTAASCEAHDVLTNLLGFDPSVLAGVQWGQTSGPVLVGHTWYVAEAIALNAGPGIEALIGQLTGGTPCLIQFVENSGGLDLTSAMTSLLGYWYPGQTSDYLTVTLNGTTGILPFLWPSPTGPVSTGQVSGGAWSGALSWSVPDLLFRSDHAAVWSGSTCGKGSELDFSATAPDALFELGKLFLTQAPLAATRSVQVAALAPGQYWWQANVTELDGTSGTPSACVLLNASGAPGTPTAPAKAMSPSPGNGATGVSLSPGLSWTSSADSYDIYVGPSLPATPVATTSSTAYAASGLSSNTTYRWRIDTKNSSGTTVGDVWSFTTAQSVTASVTLKIDGGTSSSRPIGQTFSFTGSGYTPGQTVTRTINPAVSGSTVLSPLTADGAGNITWTFSPTCGNPINTFTIVATDVATNRPSNSVTETVTNSPSCLAPTLRIDGGTSSSRPIGQTFSFTGSGYTPGQTVTRTINLAVNGSTVLSPLTADGAGNISWTFSPACGNPIDTFTIVATDTATGRQSNAVTETVTANLSCGTLQTDHSSRVQSLAMAVPKLSRLYLGRVWL